jgi:hypothetical protein
MKLIGSLSEANANNTLMTPATNAVNARGLELPATGTCGLCLLMGFMPLSANADSWAAPTAFEAYSKGSNFMAKVEPAWPPAAMDSRRPSLSVFRVEGAARLPLWSVELTNRVSPVNVLLTDDGEYAVTLDNWHHVGYGEDVIAFYQRKGLVRTYSLEAALADRPEATKRNGFRSAFEHSVSSRDWRSYSIMEFDGTTTNAVFGIWLDWAGRWFAWRLADGMPVKLRGEGLLRWNELGRAQAHAWLARPEITARPAREEMRKWTPAAMAWSRQVGERLQQQVVACRYLAYAKDPADRRLLEGAWLSSELNANWEPQLRITADRALAILDGASDSFSSLSDRGNQRYYRLGTIDLTIELPRIPAGGEGQLYVSVYPETVPGADWRQAIPRFRTGTSFKSSATKAASDVKITIPAFWPGRYWIKAVWKRNPPFQYDLFSYEGMREWKESREAAPAAGADDFESRKPEVFELKKGKAVAVKIKCTQPGS